MDVARPFVSVIIPTYNDWERLSFCLNALYKQSYPATSFEIIVANNNPLNPEPENYWKPSNCFVIDVEKPGSYAARNAAINLAKGDVFAFTDSDCKPREDWIRNGIAFFNKRTDLSRIAGRIVLFYKRDKLTNAELYEKVFAFRQHLSAKKGYSVTGNMFARKVVFDVIGNFNDSLMSGGDFEWSKRALDANFKIDFGGEVIVEHPARHEMKELIKKERRRAGWIGDKRTKAIYRLIKYLLPPVKVFQQTEMLSFADSWSVFVVQYMLNIIRSIEEVKISFGKPANRE